MSPAASSALKVSTTPRPGSRLAVEVAIPAERCQASFEAAIGRLSRSVRLPGFRPGRVPRPVLLQQLGPLRVRATALENLVDEVWKEALEQEESIEALGQPQIRDGFDSLLDRFRPDESLTLTLELDVVPKPSLKLTRGLQAEAETVAYDPTRVDELLEQSRRQLATLVPVEDRPAASGDVAQVSFRGTFADTGEEIGGGSSDGMEVELEEGRMIPGFVEGIIGMKAGETRTIECTFPEEYPQEEAAGRPARFELTLLELKTRELPALDDAFARQAGDKDTLDELRADLETRLRREAEQRSRSNRHDALLGALVEQLEVELPETLIQQEVRSLLEQTAGQIAQQGVDVRKVFTQDVVRNLMETSRPEAEQRLRRNLALRALAAAEKIEVAEKDVEARLEEVRRDLSEDASIDPERLRQAVREDLLREALMAWLEENSSLSEKSAGDAAEAEDTDASGEKPSPKPAAKPKGRAAGGGTKRARPEADEAEKPID